MQRILQHSHLTIIQANQIRATAIPAHVHTWVLHEGSGHYETQVVKEAWDEPIYESQVRDICNQCGADVTDNAVEHAKEHALVGENGGHHTEVVKVQVGTQHHDAETKQV